jgi:NNP family nitrate/nitrite transporter-like MFS transporter
MPDTVAGQRRALWLSTIAFTVWTIFPLIGVRIDNSLGLKETGLGLLLGVLLVVSALNRSLGIQTDKSRRHVASTLTMFVTAIAYFLSFAITSSRMLVAAGRASGNVANDTTRIAALGSP